MIVDRRTVGHHTLVILASLAGIMGMGTVFSGATHGSIQEMSRGIPFLLIGMWWAGQELGRSLLAARNRHATSADRE